MENSSEHSNNKCTENSFTWSDTKVKELIENVREKQVLWNFRIPLRERNKEKNKHWDDVRKALGGEVTVSEIKWKWKNLVDTFRRQWNREKKIKRSGALLGRKVKWPLFEAMSFLKDVDISDDVKNEMNASTSGTSRSNLDDCFFTTDDSLSTTDDFEEDSNNLSYGRNSSEKRISKESALDRIADAFCKESEQLEVSITPPMDEIRCLCIFIDSRLRQISEQQREDVIKRILAILY